MYLGGLGANMLKRNIVWLTHSGLRGQDRVASFPPTPLPHPALSTGCLHILVATGAQ